jgi:flagellar motor switch protein FliN/FliY
MTDADMDDTGTGPAEGPEPEVMPRVAPEEAPVPPRGRSAPFLGVPIEVTISVGKARPTVSELVALRRDSVLPLDSSIDDPVEIYIGDKLIARGELQEIGESSGRLGVRLTEVADFSNDG